MTRTKTRTALPVLTPQARALIRDLQTARRRLAVEHERITGTTPAGQDPRPDRAHVRGEGEVARRWRQLAALGLSPQHVAHYINKEGI
jgi:hypothetical protein